MPSNPVIRRLRERISPSLKRIAGTVISFSRTDEKHTREYITHLVQSAYYDTERDIVQLQADPRLFELYQFDRKVLLQLKAINALKRRESAQALYTFMTCPGIRHRYRWRGCVHASIYDLLYFPRTRRSDGRGARLDILITRRSAGADKILLYSLPASPVKSAE